jgi:uncharacterized Tic20 family protein
MDETPPPIPPVSAPPAGKDDKLWIVLCHLSLLLGIGFILPLVVYLVKRHDSPLVADHAREALNFHISVYLYAFVSVLLVMIFIGLLLLPILAIGSIVCSILAAVRASEGRFYRYPLTLRLVS